MAAVKRLLGGLLWLAVCLGLLVVGCREFCKAAYPQGYRELVERYSEENGLEPALVYAVIRTESGFHPEAESSVGARGLMQLTPDTFQWVRYRLGETGAASPDLLYDPQENIKYGAANLRLLIREFGSEETALAAYHAGWGSVSRWLADDRYSDDGRNIHHIPFADTDVYVTKVLETARLYRRLYG